MIRILKVDIRRDTWPRKGTLPAFPASFHPGKGPYDLNVPVMLLLLGFLTTPTSSTDVSLREFWAWIRYLAAVVPDPDLRLTSSFADLDAHQKTILSDDFGTGADFAESFGCTVVKGDERRAAMLIGDLYRSELILT